VRRVRDLLDTWGVQRVRLFAPDAAFDDAEKYLPKLFTQRGKPIGDPAATIDWLRSVIEPVSRDLL
jgi:hypothetical protein